MIKLLVPSIAVLFSFSVKAQACYGDKDIKHDKGYVGALNGIKIFYEAWNEQGAAGTFYSTLVLRTDTADISDSVDFCFSDEDTSIQVTILRDDTTISFATITGHNIPTVFQVLIPMELGYHYFSDFNKEKTGNKLYLKNNKLHLQYWESPRYDEPYLVSYVYAFKEGHFTKE